MALKNMMGMPIGAAAVKALPPKDGRIHSAIYRVFGQKFSTNASGYDQKASSGLDEFLCELQNAGREILSVQMTTEKGQGASGSNVACLVLVMYR